MNEAMRTRVAAFEQTVRSTIALAGTLDPGDWERPTECPGWTVKDQLAHLASVEVMLLGDPAPRHVLPDHLPHVRNDFGRLMEVGVDLRRPVPAERITAELADALERRLAALPGIDPERQVMCPDGNMGSYTRFMTFRALDCWAHEQDIRRAVGRPGNLDAPAAYCLRDAFVNGLRTVLVHRADATPGQSAVFDVAGPPSILAAVSIDEDGGGSLTYDVPADPTVRIGMSWESYVRLVAGRCGPELVEVRVEGDEDLAKRILSNMALTP